MGYPHGRELSVSGWTEMMTAAIIWRRPPQSATDPTSFHFDHLMRICYVTQAGFDAPGAERTHSTEVIRHLVKAGIRVTVIHPSRAASIRDLGADERRLCARLGIGRRIWFQLSLLL